GPGLWPKAGAYARQTPVAGPRQPARWEPAVELQVHAPAIRVRARSRAGSGAGAVVLAGRLAQRPLQLGFHCPAPRLLLPAGKSATVVLEHDFDIHFFAGEDGIVLPRGTPTSPAQRWETWMVRHGDGRSKSGLSATLFNFGVSRL